MAQTSQSTGGRPLSPHWQVWRWHVTMAASILHRLAGMGLYLGLLILAGWALSLELGSDAFAAYTGALASPLGYVILFLIVLAWLFHLANGVRHLFWDLGKGFRPRIADATAWIAIAFAALGTAAVVAALMAKGKL
jgi:succinate dehydrogenase / fumarate reductase, cytochrome b subunit